MKKILFSISILFCVMFAQAQVEKMLGDWTTIDDKTNQPKSIVQIFKATDGLYYGKITELFRKGADEAVCEKCEGADKNKPLKGLVVVKGMKADDNKLTGGTITDPQSGDVYYCKISLEKDGRLKLRGSLDKRGLLGRSQYWERKK